MYENQVNSWREKQRESSYLVCILSFLIIRRREILHRLDPRSNDYA